MQLFFLSFLFIPPSLSAILDFAAKPTVTISSGIVIGTTKPVANQPSVTDSANAWLGIPFASNPPLRFAPPEPPPPWTKPLLAHTLPPACLQQFQPGEAGQREAWIFNNPGFEDPPESEDCLYLNVFAPRLANPANLKPVLFWIFGGNLEIGTGSLVYYNGSSLAVNEDVVVVTINYRTNIFGFSNSPEVPHGQQNSGFLDQRLALQWVRANIKQFGGDPKQVTVFGESAGGWSVKQLLASPPEPLPFRAAILSSPQDLSIGNGADNYKDVVAHFGCELAVSPLHCLRQVPGIDIQAYIQNKTIVFPAVAGDGTSEGSNTLPSIQSGKFADVPILIGTNANEATIFTNILDLGGKWDDLTGVMSNLASSIPNVTEALIRTYAGHVDLDDKPKLISQILTDFFFTCTTRSLSTAIAEARRQPVWRYRYDAVFDNLMLIENGGAYHSSEIPIVFGTYPLDNELGKVTETEIELSKFMQGVWAGFARDPNHGPGWPKLGAARGFELAIFGGVNATTNLDVTSLQTADFACELLDPIIKGLGMAY